MGAVWDGTGGCLGQDRGLPGTELGAAWDRTGGCLFGTLSLQQPAEAPAADTARTGPRPSAADTAQTGPGALCCRHCTDRAGKGT